MKQKLLEAICSFLTTEDKIIDIGCDHAYVPIYMAKKGATHILATDIHENALNVAKENIQKNHLENTIETLLSDGLDKVDTKNYDTLVLAGMGASTILSILDNKEKLEPIKKIIIQSNNDLEKLRQTMMKQNFTLKEEKILEEKGHYYAIMVYQKGLQKLSEEELLLGLYNPHNKNYYNFLKETYSTILKQSQNEEIKRKLKLVLNYLYKENGTI